jgi:hypothetical protein
VAVGKAVVVGFAAWEYVEGADVDAVIAAVWEDSVWEDSVWEDSVWEDSVWEASVFSTSGWEDSGWEAAVVAVAKRKFVVWVAVAGAGTGASDSAVEGVAESLSVVWRERSPLRREDVCLCGGAFAPETLSSERFASDALGWATLDQSESVSLAPSPRWSVPRSQSPAARAVVMSSGTKAIVSASPTPGVSTESVPRAAIGMAATCGANSAGDFPSAPSETSPLSATLRSIVAERLGDECGTAYEARATSDEACEARLLDSSTPSIARVDAVRSDDGWASRWLFGGVIAPMA